MQAENVVIVGSGPAGLTAAIYTARALLKPLVFEGFAAGGQLMMTSEVDNYPGFPKGVTGTDLMALLREQAQRFDARIETRDVTRVDLSSRPFKLWVDDREIVSQTIILATGASARWLNIPSEKAFIGKGVSSCATCDGAFFRDQQVLVVGGGDTALEEALFLTRFAKQVTVVHRRDQLRASQIMQEKAKAHPQIDFIWDSVIDEVVGDASGVTGAKISNVKTQGKSERAVTGIFVAIGHDPNTALVKGQLQLDAQGYIVTQGSSRTSVEGVFAAGDVQDHVYRQAITAAGSGCQAAIDCERFLQGH